MSAFPEPTDGESVDFLEERDADTESWTRADPREALIESFGRFGYKVTLRDGESVHYCALGSRTASTSGGATARAGSTTTARAPISARFGRPTSSS